MAYLYRIPTASNTKSTHKSQIVTSDNCQVTFILSQQVFEVSSVSSHTDAQPSRPYGRLPRRWHVDADETRSCSNQAPLMFAFWQKIYINLKFLEVKSQFGNFLIKVGMSKVERFKWAFKEGARFRFNEKTNGKRPTAHGAFWCVASFYKVQYEHIQESPANAKGTRDSSACMKAHCEQM